MKRLNVAEVNDWIRKQQIKKDKENKNDTCDTKHMGNR